ncbi:hypothetical protein [Clostridium sp.]|jgi:hypothetical protein|uniref:hypothetical protein n=1 Tax=Clostridium sp. TaxID=1506 RepID=UPI003EE90521
MNNVYAFISVILSAIIFGIILDALNKSRLKLFVPLQRLVGKSKHKKIFKIAIFITVIFLSVIIKDFFTLNYIVFGILVGFFSAIVEVIFTKNDDTHVASDKLKN